MKKIFSILSVLALIVILVSCATSKESEEETVATQPAEPVVVVSVNDTAPAEEVQKPETSVADEIKDTVKEETTSLIQPVVAEPEPIKKSYGLGNLRIDVTADTGKAEIKYPTAITKEELAAAAQAAVKAYGDYLQDVTYKIEGDTITLYYPEEYGAEEFALAEAILSEEIPAYVKSLTQVVEKTEVAKSTPEATPEATPVAVSTPVVTPVSTEPIKKSYGLGNLRIDVTADTGKAEIKYPTAITKDELAAAAKAAVKAYGDYLQDVTYKIEGDTITLYYPKEYGAEEFALAEAILSEEIPAYVKSLTPVVEKTEVAKSTPEATPVAVSTPVVTPVSTEPIKKSYGLGNLRIDVTADTGKAEIKYPTAITKEELAAAAKAAVKAYGDYLQDVKYKIAGGVITLYYPEEYGADEFALAESILSEAIPSYVAALSEMKNAAQVAQQPVESEPVASAAEPAPVVSTPATTPATPAPAATPATPAPAATPATPAPAATPATTAPVEEKAKTNTAVIVIAILAGIAVIAAVVVLEKKKKN